jgi:hypothetical protein
MFRRMAAISPRALGELTVLAAVLGLTAAPAGAQTPVVVSTDSANAQGNNPSYLSALNGNGHVLAFASHANNLVANDTNGSADVFVKVLQTGAVTRVSVTSAGLERTGDSGMEGLDISEDGNLIVFSSRAALTADDTNECAAASFRTMGPSCDDIYVHDRTTGETTRISVSSAGAQATGGSVWPRMNASGQFVVFSSTAANLVPNDTNQVADVFLRDRTPATTIRVSVTSAGGESNSLSKNPDISGDGLTIVFASEASVFSADPDPLRCRSSCSRIFIHSRPSGTTLRMPMPSGILVGQDPALHSAVVNGDGRYVAAVLEKCSDCSPQPDQVEIILYDRVLDRIVRPSWVGSRFDSAITFRAGLAIAANGRYVVASGRAGLLPFLIVYDRVTGLEERVPIPDTLQYESIVEPTISNNGRIVAFSSGGPLVDADTNGFGDVYLWDRDHDRDGMTSGWETTFGFDPNVAADATGDPDGDGVTNLAESQAGSHPKGTFTRYLPEGAANAFFTTHIATFNPGLNAARSVLRFLGSSGEETSLTAALGPEGAVEHDLTSFSRLTSNDFSTIIEADQPLVVDRTMRWDATGYGSHAETALTTPGTNWFLAEGATHGPFSLFYQLQNPGDADAIATITYLRPDGASPIIRDYDVAAHSRLTIPVDGEDPLLAETDVSASITSNRPILVERAMYLGTATQPFAGGHAGAGVQSPATSWFLAEGATGTFFEMYLLIANPGNTAANLNVSYLLGDGTRFTMPYVVPRQSRLTIPVEHQDPRLASTSLSVIVESTNGQPVVVERSMWWPEPTSWHEGHLSMGSTTTGTVWALAEGSVAPGDETYVLIANTSALSGNVTVKVWNAGTVYSTEVSVLGNSRITLPMKDYFPALNGHFSTLIDSHGLPIVVERAMYTDVGGVHWAAGHAALATRLQ